MAERDIPGRKSGDNVLLGNFGDGFFDQKLEQQARNLGLSEACPVVDKVLSRGPEAARNRYAELILFRQQIMDIVGKVNPPLFINMADDLPRQDNEPVGQYEADSITPEYLKTIPWVTTPWGYSCPRLLYIEAGISERDSIDVQNVDRTSARYLRALAIVDQLASTCETPLEFLAKLAEEVAKDGRDIDLILRTTLSSGYLGEQNTFTLYGELKKNIEQYAPTLWRRYSELTLEQRAERRIAG